MFTTLSSVSALQQQPSSPVLQGFCPYPVFFSIVPDTLSFAKLVPEAPKHTIATLKRPLEQDADSHENGEETLLRRKKRRVQVAEASRRSRAKRKEEFNAIKTQNQKLLSEAVRLRARLAKLESVQNENGQRTSGGEPSRMAPLNLNFNLRLDKSLAKEIEEEKSLAIGASKVGEEDKEYYQIASFLRFQAKSFLDQLKQDYRNWFSGINGLGTIEKDERALRKLDVEVVEL